LTVPDPYTFILLAAAVYRLTRLAGWDVITIPLRSRVLGVTDAAWHGYDDRVGYAAVIEGLQDQGIDPWDWPDAHERGGLLQPMPITKRRAYWNKLVRCPWCFSIWIGAAWLGVWEVLPTATVIVSTWLALSAVAGLVARNLDP
jgi:hypothetical protein